MSQFFAEAEVLIRPNTTGFAASLEAQVQAAVAAVQKTTKPIVVPASVVATGAGSKQLTKDTTQLLVAQDATGKSVEKTTSKVAKQKLEMMTAGSEYQKLTSSMGSQERAAAKLAQRHAQLARGAEATGLSLFNIRGATLAASSSFLAGAAAITIAAKSIAAASNETEQLNKSVEVFAGSAAEVRRWSESTASSMGISQTAALAASSTYGQLFRTLGVGPARAAILSESLVKLASDLASFNNVDPTRALQALQSGLVGQARPLRQLGIFLTEARVKQEALTATGKKAASELTQQDRILARYALIMRDSALAQGDFARTQDRLANQSRILRAKVEDLGASLGGKLVPRVLDLVSGLAKVIDEAQKAGTALDGLASKGAGGGGFNLGPFSSLADVLKEAHAQIILLSRGELANFGESSRAALARLNAELDKTRQNTPEVASNLQKALQGMDSQKAVQAIRAIESSLVDTGPKTEKFREQLQAVERGIIALGHVPTTVELIWLLDTGAIPDGVRQAQAKIDSLPPLKVKAGFAKDSLVFGDTEKQKAAAAGKAAAEQFAIFFGQDLADNLPSWVTGDLFDFTPQAKEGAKKTAEGWGDMFTREIAVAVAAGDTGAELAAWQARLRKDEDVQRRAQAAFKAHPTKENSAWVTRAANIVANDKAEIERIRKEQAANAKSAQDAIITAQNAADQALIDRINARQATASRAVSKAEGTAGLKDDLAALITERAVINDIIKNTVPLIKDEKTRAQVLSALLDARVAVNNQIKALNAQQASAAAARRQQIIDDRQAHLEAILSIAQTTTRTSDDLRALNALKAFDTAQIKRIEGIKKRRRLTSEEARQLDAYKVDLAQRNEAIRNLTKEQQKGNTFAQQAFAFLQTQQGFVSNLLGNLIPGGLTSGLVGGNAPTVPTNAAAARISGGFEQPRGVNFTAGEAARTRPFSAGQGERQIDLLRRILAALVKLNQGTEHPEAKNQRASGAAAMDYARSGMGMGIG